MLKEKLMSDLKEAMKEKQVLRKNVVQMIRAAVLQVEKDKQIELTEEQVVEIIAKEAKKRKGANGYIRYFTNEEQVPGKTLQRW